MENKMLVVYFTWSGTSKIIAERIKNELNADIFQIEAVKKYPNKYITCVAQAGMEKLKKERPQLKRELENISEYKKIVLVFPNWWGTLPMPVFSFLEKYDFKENKNGKFQSVSSFAKQGRGSMLNYLIKNKINDAEKIKEYSELGYSLNIELSDNNKFIFTR